jgi:hypothetical protein
MRDHRKLPAFHSLEILFRALEDTFGLPVDPESLEARLCRAAGGAAAAVKRGCILPRSSFLTELLEAEERLQDLAYGVDLAVRAGSLDLGRAAELLEHLTSARVELALLIEAVRAEREEPWRQSAPAPLASAL